LQSDPKVLPMDSAEDVKK